MSKKRTESEKTDESNACEVIELAINDIELLTKAFNMISRVCEEIDADEDEDLTVSDGIPENQLH